MALFKVYRGDSNALPGGKDGWHAPDGSLLEESKLHDGYGYFCADTGEFFIDVDLIGDGSGLERVQINALSATKLAKEDELTGEKTVVEIDDLVLRTMPEDARIDLDVYSKNETDQAIASATTVAYDHTIPVNEWQAEGNYFVHIWTIPEGKKLQCGKNHDVPPEITFTSNLNEYSKITNAEADSATGTIKFYINKVPSDNIGIIIIDQM